MNPGTRPLKGIVAGFGRMGLTHFCILNGRRNVRIAGICDPSGFVRSSAERYLGVDVAEDYEKQIHSLEPDFVIVATPSSLHADITRCALRSHAHVFVEKPFCAGAADGLDLVRLAVQSGCVNQVGYVMRFNDVIREVRGLLGSPVLGGLVRYRVDMNAPTVLRPAKDNWRFRRREGGGCLQDFASHAIDLSAYLFGHPDRVTGTVLQRIHSEEVEDAILTTVSYSAGACGTISVNWSDPSYRKPAVRIEASGKTWRLLADLHGYKVFFDRDPGLDGFGAGWNHRYITDCFRPVEFYLRGYEFSAQMEHFLGAIANGTPTACSFHDGWRTDALIERIRNTSQERQEITSELSSSHYPG